MSDLKRLLAETDESLRGAAREFESEPGRKRCGDCANLMRETESWELSHIWWWSCGARHGMENLRSFPFQNTKCKAFTPIK